MSRAISAEVRMVWQSTSTYKKIQYEKLMFQIMKHAGQADKSKAGTKEEMNSVRGFRGLRVEQSRS
jgi:hypothetical protein